MTRIGTGRGRALPAAAPAALRWASLAAVVAVVMLIGSGAWVRLSGSGLGCPTWPDCTRTALVAPASYHALVEFVNRCVITAVGVLTGTVLVAAALRRPRRRDLIWLAAGLAAGYLGEAVLGGLTVLFKLPPALVAAHLVLAMLLLADAVVLHWRSAERPAASAVVDGATVLLADLMLLAMAAVVIAGTVATGAGPHSGSPGTPRFGIPFRAAVELHASTGIFLFGLTVAMALLLRSVCAPRAAWRRYGAVTALMVVQGSLGYATYFSHVLVDVTELHVFIGALLAVALLRLRLGFQPARPGAGGRSPRLAAADGGRPVRTRETVREGVPNVSQHAR